MKLSEDRVSHLSHIIIDTFYQEDLVDYPDDDDQEALRAVKRIFNEYLALEEAADQEARRKISSQSKPIVEGSREWDILYGKYLEEEINKKFP